MARQFSGAQYLESTTVLIAIPFTVSFWFRGDSDSGGLMGLLELRNGMDRVYLYINWTGATNALTADMLIGGGASSPIAVTTTCTTGQWYHACYVVASSTSRTLYLDGGSSVSESGNKSPSAMSTIWPGYASAGGYWSGRLAHLAIYSSALGADKVASLASRYVPPLVCPSAGQHHWPMGGFDGDTDVDRWGGKNLTAFGSPTYVDQCPMVYPSCAPGYTAAPAASTAKPWLYARRSARIIGGGVS